MRITIEYLNYPRVVETAKKVRVKYYLESKKDKLKIKKYATERYIYKAPSPGSKDRYLFDTVTNEFVIANPKAVGKAKYHRINGQDIWTGIHHNIRVKVAATLHEFFNTKLEHITPIDTFPIIVNLRIYDTLKHKNHYWDVDNRTLIYNKVFMDAIVRKGIIPDDKNVYVSQPPSSTFIPIEEHEIPRLVYTIETSKDNEVLKQYNKLIQIQ